MQGKYNQVNQISFLNEKIMEKKWYEKPSLKVVVMKQRAQLLSGSDQRSVRGSAGFSTEYSLQDGEDISD